MASLDPTYEKMVESYKEVGKVWRECHDDRIDKCANHNTRTAERKLEVARRKLADAIANVEDAKRLLR